MAFMIKMENVIVKEIPIK